MNPLFHTATVLAALFISASSALAQTAAVKAADQQGAANRLMTRDELRACMNLQDEIKAKAVAVQATQKIMAQEKQELTPARDGLKPLRDDVEKYSNLFKKTDADVRDHAKRIDQWNAEMKEVEESSMRSAEQRKKQLQKEQPGLVARNNELIAAREQQYKLYEAAVERFNTRGKGLEASVQDWNERNERLADDADKVLDLREKYAQECSRRRFREEDEQAIRQGK